MFKTILKVKLFCIIYIFLSASYATANDHVFLKGYKMSKQEINFFFDINKFEKHRDGSEWNFTPCNGTRVRQIKSSNSLYIVEVMPYSYDYVYSSIYNEKGELTTTNTRFYGNPIGKLIYFNNKQQIIKEIDNDQPYPFTIEALAKLLKNNYDIDLYDPHQIQVMQRYMDNLNMHKPVYVVYAYQKKETGKLDGLLIDGETGKVLFQIESYPRSAHNVYDEYIKTTEEYKKGLYKIED